MRNLKQPRNMSHSSPAIERRRWFYADSENQPVGPMSEENLRLLRQNGVISADTLLLPDGGSEWTPFNAVFSEALAVSPPVPLMPSETALRSASCPFCAEAISPTAKKCKHCGEVLDVALRAAEEAKRTQVNQPMVFMNAGGGAAVVEKKKRFPFLIHLLLTLLTGGFWGIIWALHYLFRDKNYYR